MIVSLSFWPNEIYNGPQIMKAKNTAHANTKPCIVLK